MAGVFFKQYKYFLIIMAGVIIGTLIANIGISNITDKIGVFDYDFKNSFINVELDTHLYWRYILKLRIKEYMLLILILITPIAMQGIYMLMSFAGISIGVIISVSVMNMGVAGMCVYAASALPQYIIYAVTIYFMVSSFGKRYMDLKKMVAVIIISLICLVIGTLYEAYINPWILKILLKHISYGI